MSQPNKIPLPFAASGDKNAIPENTETTGLASWREGFPAITSAPFSEGGIAPKRADFNGIFNALSQAVMWLQQGGVYAYDVNTNYEAGNVVLDAGGLYVANTANGPSSAVVQPSTDTTGATWKLVRLDLATQSAAGYMSAADKTRLDSVILTNATQSAAGYMSAADKAALDNVPTTYFPLLGGALSGQIISRDVTNSALRLLGGTTNENGGYISLWGNDTGVDSGYIYAIARTSASVSSTLKLTPAGTLSWRSFDVPYCFTGSASNVARGDFVNFLVSPPKTPSRIYVFHPSSTPSSLAAYGISKTGFYLGTSLSPVDNVYYIAFCLGGGNS